MRRFVGFVLVLFLFVTPVWASGQLSTKWQTLDGFITFVKVQVRADRLEFDAPSTVMFPKWAVERQTVSGYVVWELSNRYLGWGPTAPPPRGECWVWNGDEWRLLKVTVTHVFTMRE